VPVFGECFYSGRDIGEGVESVVRVDEGGDFGRGKGERMFFQRVLEGEFCDFVEGFVGSCGV